MSSLRSGIAFAWLLGSAVLGGCAGDAPTPAQNGGSGGGSGRGAGGGGPGGGIGMGTGGGAVVPSNDPLLPARVRRLTNVEYQASVRALFGGDTPVTVA